MAAALQKGWAPRTIIKLDDPMINENRVIFLVVAVMSVGWAVASNYLGTGPEAMSQEAVIRCGLSTDLINGDTLGRQGLVGSLRWAPLPTLLVLPLLAVPDLARTGFAACVLAGLALAAFAVVLNAWLAHCRVSRFFRYPAVALLVGNPLWQKHIAAGKSSVLFALLIVAICCMLIHWLQTLELRNLAYMSILCGLVVVTRYQAALFVGLVFLVVLAYLLVEREKEAYTEGTLIVLLSPTVYAVGLWFAANWLIMGDPFFFLRGLPLSNGAGMGWEAVLTESCEWSLCLLPLFVALFAWIFSQFKPRVWLRLLGGLLVVALPSIALFVQMHRPSQAITKEEADADVELEQVISEIEKTHKDHKVVVSGYMGYRVRRATHTYGIFRHLMSVYLDEVLGETRGQKLYFLTPADRGDGRWEDVNLTYPGIYENGAAFTIFEKAWPNWRLFQVVRIDRPRRLVQPPGATAAGSVISTSK